MKESMLGQMVRKQGLSAFLHEWLGNASHRWMWDYKGLVHELGQIGFVNIRRAEFGDSLEPRFSDVEEFYRWESCLGIECRRPLN